MSRFVRNLPLLLSIVHSRVADGGLLNAEQLDHQGDQTVCVTLIGLRDHLVNKPLDVRGSLPELWSVVHYDGHCCSCSRWD